MRIIIQTFALLLFTVFPLSNLLGQTPPKPVDFWDVQRIYQWDSIQSNWSPFQRLTATRNASGQMTGSLYEEHDGTNFALVNRTSTYPGTTNNDPEKSYLIEIWVNNAWKNALRVAVPLDALGNELGNYREAWNGSSWDTLSAQRNTNVTNANNQLTEQVSENLTANGWVDVARNRFSYDANMEVDTFYSDVMLNGNWTTIIKRVDYTWFDFSQNLPTTYSELLEQGNGLAYDRKFDFTYSVNQLVASSSNFTNGTPILADRNIRDFDAQGRLTHLQYEVYNSTNNAWEYNNDRFYNITYFNHSSGPQPTEIIETRATQPGQQKNFVKREFEFVASGSADASAFNSQVKVFPNPFEDRVQIQINVMKKGIASMSLLDAVGKQVITREWAISPGDNALQMPLPQLPAGMYHYRISLHGDIITGKLIH